MGQGEVCGVESYNERTDVNCGKTKDYIKQEFDPGYRNCQIGSENVNAELANNLGLFDRFFPESEWNSCTNYRGKQGKSGEMYYQSTCQNRSSGHWWVICKAEVAKTCRLPEFGVEKYKSCIHPSFGVTYNTCRNESFGKENCLEWYN